jgi:ComF family protein
VTARFDLESLFKSLASAVFPPQCAACGRISEELFCSTCALSVQPVAPFLIEGTGSARARFAYGGAVALAIHRFKYRGVPELGRPFAQALLPLFTELEKVDALVPVPLSPSRLRDRGYNQARELLRGMPYRILSRALVRRDAREQVGLAKSERIANVKALISAGPDAVRGQNLVLVDDVVTTGATATACVRVLLEAGARTVSVVALARTDNR